MLTTRQRYAPPIITKQSSGGPKVVAMFSKVASNWFQSPSTIVSKFSQSCLKIGSKLSQSFLGAVWRLFQSFFEVVWKLCQYFLKAVSRLSNRIIKQKKKGLKSFRKTATKTALKKDYKNRRSLQTSRYSVYSQMTQVCHRILKLLHFELAKLHSWQSKAKAQTS